MPAPDRLVLLGQPVSHSLSPVFQNAALAHAGLAARYTALDVSTRDLSRVIRELAQSGAAGNVTIPHKEDAAACCDVLTPLARRIGAINTWWWSDGALHGDNTDAGGFTDAIVTLLGSVPVGARVAVLGAGGAARAVVAALAEWPGCDVAIWSRTPDRSAYLVGLGPADRTRREEIMADALRGATLVVNTTPIGLRDEQVPVNPGVLSARASVYDLVYRRDGDTPFVRLARAQGRRAADGLGMLIAQGARSWASWFDGLAPDRDVMWRAALAARETGTA
jgi:shikimate dehydrogenase